MADRKKDVRTNKVDEKNENLNNEVENSQNAELGSENQNEDLQNEIMQNLQTELSKAVVEAEEFKDTAQRLRAEFENYKKRNSTLASDSKLLGVSMVLEQLLPVLDNCERAKSMIQDESTLEGFNLIEQQINDVFEKFDVKEIDALGKDFDANLMNAVMREENSEQSGKVLEVFTKGYTVQNKVLRYAIVKVAF